MVGACGLRTRVRATCVFRDIVGGCVLCTDVPTLDSEQMARIMEQTLSSSKMRAGSDIDVLLNEVNIDFGRTMNRLIFDLNLAGSAMQGLPAAVKVPAKATRAPAQFGMVQIPVRAVCVCMRCSLCVCVC